MSVFLQMTGQWTHPCTASSPEEARVHKEGGISPHYVRESAIFPPRRSLAELPTIDIFLRLPPLHLSLSSSSTKMALDCS